MRVYEDEQIASIGSKDRPKVISDGRLAKRSNKGFVIVNYYDVLHLPTLSPCLVFHFLVILLEQAPYIVEYAFLEMIVQPKQLYVHIILNRLLEGQKKFSCHSPFCLLFLDLPQDIKEHRLFGSLLFAN